MAANWQPTNGFEQLVTRLFLGALYASTARYPMEERDIIDIGLRVIKCCRMYAEEYKAWIGIKNAGQLAPPHVKQTLDSFKGFWSNAITLVNQMSVPALQHGYGMAAMDNDGGSIASYGESLANFGTGYAAIQETVKSQADSLSAIQAAATQQHLLRPPTATASSQQQQEQPQRQRRQRLQRQWWGLPATTNLAPRPTKWWPWACVSPHALQVVGELDLLPHAWR
jgi:hypothetical protein